MNKIGINSVLVFLIIVSNVEGKGGVTIENDKAKLTCPGIGEWYKMVNDKDKYLNKNQSNYEIDLYDKDSYCCLYNHGGTSANYTFYITGCENCYKLNTTLVVVCIVGDLLFTGCFILIVYLWAKKRSQPGEPQKTTTH
ncbi:hypothetical protein DPEC_G00298140 [Dallia pectoralis]|uniref:Uncharacterized protein n=1 Tax=Dallia pectoralis TaxID=75939 RepID=A0ACC2FFY3_DALPE|nr:hypothetical protein DPEC_G00298140 [Dallia pectoralis]